MTEPRANTPMLDQYWRLKGERPDALLFFRLGDFYELFEQDAQIAAPLLDLQLTSRDGRVAMCGVPYHAGLTYARRLLDRGYTVAIAEQVEDPRTAHGLVDRQIVRVLTPGTVMPEEDERPPRLGVALRHRNGVVLVVAELSTGVVKIAQGSWSNADLRGLAELWGTWRPQEYLSNFDQDWLDTGVAVSDERYFRRMDALAQEKLLRDKLGLASLRRWGLSDQPPVRQALSALARYLGELQSGPLPHLQDVQVVQPSRRMRLSWRALQQLDIVGGRSSLLARLDLCVTKMGSRRLGEWLETPVVDVAEISARQAVVSAWVDDTLERRALRDQLAQVGDLSRRVARLVMGLGGPRDVAAIQQALAVLPSLWRLDRVWPAPDALVPERWEQLAAVLTALASPAPPRWEEPPLVADGIDPAVDEMRQLVRGHREALAELEAAERERSGIKSLRVGFHRSFGYYLEVTKSQAQRVPPDWHRRQTTTHTERFVSDPLRALELKIAEADEALAGLEREWGERLRAAVVESSDWLMQAAAWLAEIDALQALAEAAVTYRLSRPALCEPDAPVKVVGMRHPVLESVVEDYVSSDLELPTPHTALIITGPNMGGKSTFMRALAQNALLAQIGSFVACQVYQAPVFDAVLTRIGADDDLVRGQSTFMVEMEEVAAILHEVTPASLVLLDELGRGTSTYDGMAIARAVIERLAQPAGPLTLCATHYHELTDLADVSPEVRNLTVEVLENLQGPVFTHRVLPGRASRSYGLEVARQAGLPASVIRRAKSHLSRLESEDQPVPEGPQQITFENPDPVGQELVHALLALNPDDLSPREAWLWVAEQRSRVERGEG